MRRLSLTLLGVCSIGFSSAQVQNNSIKERIQLSVDAPFLHSTTAKSTVEWECVNKALTNRCVVYHNDQWYFFSVDAPGTYYLNISAQQCRDKLGVQVIVIEGNPCETNTYRILECVSKILHEEFFIPLDRLKSSTIYLIDIDGFLGDHCEFDIQVGTKPFGVPLESKSMDTLKVITPQEGRHVEIRWRVSPDAILPISVFKVYKARSPFLRSTLEREVMVERNAYGVPLLEYSLRDTLDHDGTFKYQVFGIQKESLVPLLFSENQVTYHEKWLISKFVPPQTVFLSLDYKINTSYEVRVYEQGQHGLLAQYQKEYDTKSPLPLEIDFSEFISKGLKSFLVLIIGTDSKEGKEYYFTLDKTGKVVRN